MSLPTGVWWCWWPNSLIKGAAAPGVIDPGQPLTDARALCWVRDRLADSGLFASVAVGRQARDPGGAGYPGAYVRPLSFTESDDVDPVQLTRTLRYSVSISIVPEDPADELGSMEALDELSNQTADLLSAGLPDGAVVGLTRLESGSYQQPNATATPSGAQNTVGITLLGAFAYLIDGRAGRETDFGN